MLGKPSGDKEEDIEIIVYTVNPACQIHTDPKSWMSEALGSAG